jgi:hypothetical protein
MTRIFEFRYRGHMILAMAYASETASLHVWIGGWHGALTMQDDSPPFTGAGRWTW